MKSDIERLSEMLENEVFKKDVMEDVLANWRGRLPILPFKILVKSKILRSSTNNDLAFHNNIARLSYPPIDKSKTDRASLKGIPMFYGSIFTSAAEKYNAYPSIMTAFETMDILRDYKSKGCVFTTQSLWVNNRELKVFAFPFSKRYKKPCNEILHVQENWERISKEEDPEAVAMAEYIGDLMAIVNESCLYDITASVVHDILYNWALSDNLDGIIYPSVWGDGQGMNVCLKRETVDECVRFKGARLVCIQKDEGESTVETVANSVDVGNGNLRWKSTKSALTLLRRQYSDKQLVEGRILEIE